ncbi:protein BPS1, chloroplastic isoform X2 [Neltuma alba]|nr:protein BPS1, chloroplastic-like isoform X2 [Prosopis alba]
MPKNEDEIRSISWMTLAMESLCETHNDIKTLALDIDLPVSDWDEKWIDVYLDISVKLLDICIAFSSELSRLNQGHLLLQCALHNLNTPSPQQFVRACSSIDGWRNHISSRNPRIEKCDTILDNLLGSLDLPKVKNSAKGKVLMQAMYGVKVQTAFLCSVFAAVFSGSAEKLLGLDVADTYLWAQAFTSLRNVVNEEIKIKVRFSNGRFAVLKELEAVDAFVKKLYPIIQGEQDAVETEALQKTVEETSRAAEKLSQGLDHLAKEVDGFFRVVLSGRDALLSSLRSGATFCDNIPRGTMDEQRVN